MMTNAASSGGALSLTFPSGNGTSGQYLQTDGSGNLTWVQYLVVVLLIQLQKVIPV